jgi:XFP-like protein
MAGLAKLFRQFSFPGGIPSHVAPETPGSIHEGGELGYSLAHAYGAAFDNPDLLVACVIGDGEAETGPLAASWHSSKFLDPARDGAVLPILHLNGYKIANPTVLARIPEEELESLLRGYGYEVHTVSGDDPAQVHQQFATVPDTVTAEIHAIQRRAREQGDLSRHGNPPPPARQATAAAARHRTRVPPGAAGLLAQAVDPAGQRPETRINPQQHLLDLARCRFHASLVARQCRCSPRLRPAVAPARIRGSVDNEASGDRRWVRTPPCCQCRRRAHVQCGPDYPRL